MGGIVAKKGKKNRKYGNNLAGAVIYKAENRYERNRKRTLNRHIKAQPNDLVAIKALKREVPQRRVNV